jgi:hypothetical protein
MFPSLCKNGARAARLAKSSLDGRRHRYVPSVVLPLNQQTTTVVYGSAKLFQSSEFLDWLVPSAPLCCCFDAKFFRQWPASRRRAPVRRRNSSRGSPKKMCSDDCGATMATDVTHCHRRDVSLLRTAHLSSLILARPISSKRHGPVLSTMLSPHPCWMYCTEASYFFRHKRMIRWKKFSHSRSKIVTGYYLTSGAEHLATARALTQELQQFPRWLQSPLPFTSP